MIYNIIEWEVCVCKGGNAVKHVNMLIWLTQLGLSVAVPPAFFILLSVWLNRRQGWGSWVIVVGIILGLICAVDGMRNCLKAMARQSSEKPTDEPPGISFNDHE